MKIFFSLSAGPAIARVDKSPHSCRSMSDLSLPLAASPSFPAGQRRVPACLDLHRAGAVVRGGVAPILRFGDRVIRPQTMNRPPVHVFDKPGVGSGED